MTKILQHKFPEWNMWMVNDHVTRCLPLLVLRKNKNGWSWWWKPIIPSHGRLKDRRKIASSRPAWDTQQVLGWPGYIVKLHLKRRSRWNTIINLLEFPKLKQPHQELETWEHGALKHGSWEYQIQPLWQWILHLRKKIKLYPFTKGSSHSTPKFLLKRNENKSHMQKVIHTCS